MDALAYITPIRAPDESSLEAERQQAVADEAQLRTEIRNLNESTVKKPDKDLAHKNWSEKHWHHSVHVRAFDIIVWQEVIKTLSPALCTALGAWLHARYGRKVRIKIGDIEAEAQTREDVEKLLARAQEIQQEIQQRNQQPKIFP